MLSHLLSGWKGLHKAKDKQLGKKLEDVACKRGSLFQVWDFQPGFFHSTSRSCLSWSCVLPQRNVKIQLVKKSTLVPLQGNLFIPRILTFASHLEKRGPSLS